MEAKQLSTLKMEGEISLIALNHVSPKGLWLAIGWTFVEWMKSSQVVEWWEWWLKVCSALWRLGGLNHILGSASGVYIFSQAVDL